MTMGKITISFCFKNILIFQGKYVIQTITHNLNNLLFIFYRNSKNDEQFHKCS